MYEEVQPDFSSYSYIELKSCLKNIDKKKYPERAETIRALLSDTENAAELRRRDDVKFGYNFTKDKLVHFTFELILLVLSLVALWVIGYYY